MFKTKSLAQVQMDHQENDVTLRGSALAAGFGLLLMFVPAIFSNFMVIENVLVPGDAAATTANILANEGQFRLGIISILLVIVLDVIVAWGLYEFFKPADKGLSLLTGWFRLVYAALFGAALFNLVGILRFIALAQAGMLPGDGQTQILLSLQAYSDQWSFALSIFGIHLVLLGILAFKSGYVPKILGILVLIAGLGYVIDSIAAILMPDAGIAVGMFTFAGEMLLAIWLVVKGLRRETSSKAVLESAS